MTRILIALGALLVFSASALAQETPKSDSTQTPAVATPDSTNPAAPVPGENSFTEGQAKERMEAKGFTEISGLTKGEDGIWVASAKKDGKPVEVKLDFQGNITESAK